MHVICEIKCVQPFLCMFLFSSCHNVLPPWASLMSVSFVLHEISVSNSFALGCIPAYVIYTCCRINVSDIDLGKFSICTTSTWRLNERKAKKKWLAQMICSRSPAVLDGDENKLG